MQPKDISKQDNCQDKSLSEWDNAIEHAKKSIERLKRAIQTFQENKKAGTPWPSSTEGHSANERRTC
jgi:predicted translin family RNA/ssDNA-binding protein